jgi:hypothetical protein
MAASPWVSDCEMPPLYAGTGNAHAEAAADAERRDKRGLRYDVAVGSGPLVSGSSADASTYP